MSSQEKPRRRVVSCEVGTAYGHKGPRQLLMGFNRAGSSDNNSNHNRSLSVQRIRPPSYGILSDTDQSAARLPIDQTLDRGNMTDFDFLNPLQFKRRHPLVEKKDSNNILGLDFTSSHRRSATTSGNFNLPPSCDIKPLRTRRYLSRQQQQHGTPMDSAQESPEELSACDGASSSNLSSRRPSAVPSLSNSNSDMSSPAISPLSVCEIMMNASYGSRLSIGSSPVLGYSSSPEEHTIHCGSDLMNAAHSQEMLQFEIAYLRDNDSDDDGADKAGDMSLKVLGEEGSQSVVQVVPRHEVRRYIELLEHTHSRKWRQLKTKLSINDLERKQFEELRASHQKLLAEQSYTSSAVLKLQDSNVKLGKQLSQREFIIRQDEERITELSRKVTEQELALDELRKTRRSADGTPRRRKSETHLRSRSNTHVSRGAAPDLPTFSRSRLQHMPSSSNDFDASAELSDTPLSSGKPSNASSSSSTNWIISCLIRVLAFHGNRGPASLWRWAGTILAALLHFVIQTCRKLSDSADSLVIAAKQGEDWLKQQSASN